METATHLCPSRFDTLSVDSKRTYQKQEERNAWNTTLSEVSRCVRQRCFL